MMAALRYEWARMFTLRSTWWIVALSILIPAGLAGLLAANIAAADFEGYEDVVTAVVLTQGAVLGFPLLVAYLTSLLGVFTFGHEYRHGMVRATLTAVPRRAPVMVAKVVLTAIVVAATSLVSMLASLLVGLAFGGTRLIDAGDEVTWQVVGGVVGYSTLFALVGLALAAIFRNQIAALVTVLLAPTVVEQVLAAVLTIPDALSSVEFLTRYLPFDAGSQLYKPSNVFDVTEVFGPTPLEPLTGGLVMLLFTAVLLALAYVLFAERDA
jgi:ABC-type transport system involved in multi-copper enzyme maturation permease subunit